MHHWRVYRKSSKETRGSYSFFEGLNASLIRILPKFLHFCLLFFKFSVGRIRMQALFKGWSLLRIYGLWLEKILNLVIVLCTFIWMPRVGTLELLYFHRKRMMFQSRLMQFRSEKIIMQKNFRLTRARRKPKSAQR